MGHSKRYLRNARVPKGFLGRKMMRHMNESHSTLIEWGLEHILYGPNFQILDIGCGGGNTMRLHAQKAPTSMIHGMDISPDALKVASKVIGPLVNEGRVQLKQGSVELMPYSDNSFDLITGVETHYFWPNLDANFKEVLRVLKPGGRFFLIAEAYKGVPEFDEKNQYYVDFLKMHYLTPEETDELFRKTGFAEIEIDLEESKNWICARGLKSKTN